MDRESIFGIFARNLKVSYFFQVYFLPNDCDIFMSSAALLRKNTTMKLKKDNFLGNYG